MQQEERSGRNPDHRFSYPITTDGMATPTPVTAITFTELYDIDPGGIVSEQIGTLPQFLEPSQHSAAVEHCLVLLAVRS